MKHLSIFISLFFMILAVATAFAGQAKTSTSNLIIHITGFENSDGVAKVALVNSKKIIVKKPRLKDIILTLSIIGSLKPSRFPMVNMPLKFTMMRIATMSWIPECSVFPKNGMGFQTMPGEHSDRLNIKMLGLIWILQKKK